jgi:hypothetical protein
MLVPWRALRAVQLRADLTWATCGKARRNGHEIVLKVNGDSEGRISGG